MMIAQPFGDVNFIVLAIRILLVRICAFQKKGKKYFFRQIVSDNSSLSMPVTRNFQLWR